MIPSTLWFLPVLALACLPLGLAGVRFWRTRTMQTTGRSGARSLLLQETLFLDPRRRLHLLTCDGKKLVLLTGGTQDVVVGWLPES